MKERTKGFIAGMLVSVLLLGVVGTAAATSAVRQAALNYADIKVTVDGKTVTPRDVNGKAVEPFIIDGTTYLPVRGIATALGMNVTWDQKTHTVAITGGSASSSGKQQQAASAAQINTGTLKNCYVDIRHAQVTTAADGGDAVVITYALTNNSQYTISSASDLRRLAAQDGVELAPTALSASVSGIFDLSNESAPIEPGAIREIQVAYALRNRTSSVSFKLTDTQSKTVQATFTIAGQFAQGQTAQSRTTQGQTETSVVQVQAQTKETGSTPVSGRPPVSASEVRDYVLNIRADSRTIHCSDCPSVDRMNENNKKFVTDSLNNIEKDYPDYERCGNCLENVVE